MDLEQLSGRPISGARRPSGVRVSSIPRPIAWIAAIVCTTVVAAGLGPAPASAADVQRFDAAALEWGINLQHQKPAQNGGCDYFGAGAGDGTLASYSSSRGAVRIIKRTADGSMVGANVASRCRADGADDTNGQRLLFGEGRGTRAADGSVSIRWTGTATINSYSGLVPWQLSDPRLELDARGDGQLRATLGGFGSREENPLVKYPVTPVEDVVVAEIRGARTAAASFEVTPLFEGVDYYPLVAANDPASGRTPGSAIPVSAKKASSAWGSWPTGLVDFQYTTGLSSYWHTSGGAADARKPPMPISVTFDAEAPVLAPSFDVAPADITVSAGGTAVFTASGSGMTTPTTTWQRQVDGAWADIASGTTLRLPDVGRADDGVSYRAVLTGAGGVTTSDPVTLSVVEKRAVVITRQPADLTVAAGSLAMVSAAAEGSTLRYQWQRSIDGGDWTDVSDRTAATLAIWEIDPAEDGVRYRVLIDNGVDDAVASKAMTIKVTTTQLAITTQPRSVTTQAGTSLTMTAASTGAPKGTWTWETRPASGGEWTVVLVQRALAGPSLTFSEVKVAQDGLQVRVRGTNGHGTEVVSRVATLGVVAPASGPDLRIAPAVGIDPSVDNVLSLRGAQLDTTGIDLDAAVRTLRIYLVEKNSWTPGGEAVGNVGARSIDLGDVRAAGGIVDHTMTVRAGRLDAAKAYELISYWQGDPTDTRFITRHPVLIGTQTVPRIAAQPTSRVVASDSDVTVEVGVVGSPTPVVRWQRAVPGGKWVDVPGATGTSLTLEGLTTTDDGTRVRAIAANVVGEAVSASADISVVTVPVIRPLQSAVVAVGGSATFSAEVESGGAVTYRWQRSDDGRTWADVAGATDASITVKNARSAESGARFRVEVTGIGGVTFSQVAVLTVRVDGVVVTSPPNAVKATAGRTAVFRVTTSGSFVSHQWQRSTDRGVTWHDVPGADSSVLRVKARGAANGDRYRVVVENPSGRITTTSARISVVRATSRTSALPKNAPRGTTITVRVASAPGLPRATGTVELRRGSKVVAKVKVANGKATIRVPRALKADRHRLRLVYAGNADLRQSRSAIKWVDVR